MRPRIRYCDTPAGRVAYSTTGAGPPLLCDTGWRKLGVRSRAQIAAWVTEHRLGRATPR